MTTTRERIVTWEDPCITAQSARQMAGLDFLQAVGSGDMPAAPIMRLIGMSPVEVTSGRAVFALDPAEHHYNPMGVVHGGVISTILDTAMACAVHSTLPVGTAYTTVELHVNFLRPITAETGTLRCEGETIHVGRTIATAQGRLVDASGKLYAHGTTTCALMRADKPE